MTYHLGGEGFFMGSAVACGFAVNGVSAGSKDSVCFCGKYLLVLVLC